MFNLNDNDWINEEADWMNEEVAEIVSVQPFGLSNITDCKKFFNSIAPKYFVQNGAFSYILSDYDEALNGYDFTDMTAFSNFLLTEILESLDKDYFYNSSCKQSVAVERSFNSKTMGELLNILRNKILNVA